MPAIMTATAMLLCLCLAQEPSIDDPSPTPKSNAAAQELLTKPEGGAPTGAPAAEGPPTVEVGDVIGTGKPKPAAATGEAQAAADIPSAEPSTPPRAWYLDMLHSGLMGYMIEGGLFMWPIFVLGVLAAGVIIERYRSLQLLKTDTASLRNQVRELLEQDQVEEALALCDAQTGPVPAILSHGLRKYLLLRRLNYDPAKVESDVVKAMDDYGVHIVAALERHLPILATVSSVAPMIGFLGTVQGMVVSFKDIVAQMGEKNIVEAAAAGIQVSLLTTVLGLLVGIPAFVGYNYFTSLINSFVLEVEESSTELIETVTLQQALQPQTTETVSA